MKVMDELHTASFRFGQGDTGALLKQQAKLVRDKMVASLREKQGHVRVAAAELRVRNLASEIGDLSVRIANASDDIVTLTSAADALLRSGRQLVDMVMEDV